MNLAAFPFPALPRNPRFRHVLAAIVAGVTAIAPVAAAGRIDLLDFIPREPDAQYTLKGTTYLDGKTHPSVFKLRVLNWDDYGRQFSWRTSLELVAGPKRFASIEEIEIDAQGFRPVRNDIESDKRRQIQIFDAWPSTRPRLIELGKSYTIGHHYGAITVVGKEMFSIESVTTDLGTFECLRLSGEYEKTVEGDKATRSRVLSREWYARGFGLVKSWYSTSHETGMMEFDGIVVASTRPAVFQPVLVAKP